LSSSHSAQRKKKGGGNYGNRRSMVGGPKGRRAVQDQELIFIAIKTGGGRKERETPKKEKSNGEN